METVQFKFLIRYTSLLYLIARFLAFIEQLKKLLRNLSVCELIVCKLYLVPFYHDIPIK